MLDARRQAESHAPGRSSAIRRSKRASRSTRWRSACRLGAGADGSLEGAAEHLRAVRPGRAQARHLRRELPAGAAPAERDVRFIQLYHRGWDQHNDLPRDLALQCKGTDQRVRGAGHRPEAARPARRHAGDLGRRIRPHRLLPGQADRRRTTAATIIRAASPCGWPAAASSPASASARPTTTATTSSPTRSTSTICRPPSCNCLGVDHTKLTYKFQGRHFRLTDVHGEVVKEVLA